MFWHDRQGGCSKQTHDLAQSPYLSPAIAVAKLSPYCPLDFISLLREICINGANIRYYLSYLMKEPVNLPTRNQMEHTQ